MLTPVSNVYQRLAAGIEQAGFHAVIRPAKAYHENLMCASERNEHGGLTGTSFWVVLVDHRWYVGTWNSRIRRLAKDADILKFCLDYLGCDRPRLSVEIPESIFQQYMLLDIDGDEFESNFVDTWIPYALRTIHHAQVIFREKFDRYWSSASEVVRVAQVLKPDLEVWDAGQAAVTVDGLPANFSIEIEVDLEEWRATASSPTHNSIFSIERTGQVTATRRTDRS